MHNLLMVVRREYLDRVTKKSFWIGTAIFPFLMVFLVGGQIFLAQIETGDQRRIAFVDATGKLAEPVRQELEAQKLRNGEPAYIVEVIPPAGGVEETRKPLEKRLGKDDLFAILTAGDELDGEENFRFYGRNVGDMDALRAIDNALGKAVVALRFERSALPVDRAAIEKLTAGITLETYSVTEKGEATKKGFFGAYFGTFAFVLVLYTSLLVYGIAVMRGILEEKSSRVMEVLLGALSPDELMTGKILGIGLVGLTQMAVYVVAAGTLRLYLAAQGGEGELGAVLEAFTPLKLAYFILFFLLGYFMYTAIFAAIGAVCNTEQEAQNLQSPVILCLVIPMLATFFLLKNPDSTAATVVSLIPLFTPMVMFMRISVVTPPFWEILLSIVLLVVTIGVLFKGVAKIFRIGVLMYGKRPTIPEILRWARG